MVNSALDQPDILESNDNPNPNPLPKPKKALKAARASRACTSCRKQKTRCFPAPNTFACLRCKTLALECSFLEDAEDGINNWDSNQLSLATRLDNLEQNVSRILKVLEEKSEDDSNRKRKRVETSSRSNGLQQPYIRSKPRRMSNSLLNARGDEGEEDNSESESLSLAAPTAIEDRLKGAAFGRSSLSFNASPFNILGSLCPNTFLPLQIARLYEPQMVVHDQNIISLGIVTTQEACDLLNNFRENYNRWVSFPEDILIEELLDRILQRCSFLLTICCCVSIRFYKKSLRLRVYDQLLSRLLTELTQSLVVVPQTIEFMQALCILAIHASSLSKGDIIFDAWFFSGIALKHFITKDVLGLVMSFDGVGPTTEFDEITAYRVWNHLCLVHLVNCVQSGRMCILDEIRLNMCRRTLDLTSATNFDGRMIAEITLQTIVYKFITSDLTLQSIEYELQDWMEEWKYLFEQPTVQFVEAGYHYGYFMVLYYWNYIQSVVLGENNINLLTTTTTPLLNVGNEMLCDQTITSCDDEAIKEMIEHLSKVVESLLSFDDDGYFSHLSDQILFCGAFGALMSIKILSTIKRLDRTQILSTKTTKTCLKNIGKLSKRFLKVSMVPDDLPSKYGNSISSAMALLDSQG